MPLTTYVANEVLTAASLNNNFSFAVGTGLVRVGGGTLSSTSTTFDNVFTSTYKSYAIVFSSCALSSSTTANIQLRYSGGTQSTAYYSGQFTVSYLAATAAAGTDNGAAWNIVSATSAGFSGIVTVSGIDNSVRPTYQSSMNSTVVDGLYIAGGDCNQIRTYTGFIVNSTATLSGTVNIYGYSLS